MNRKKENPDGEFSCSKEEIPIACSIFLEQGSQLEEWVAAVGKFTFAKIPLSYHCCYEITLVWNVHDAYPLCSFHLKAFRKIELMGKVMAIKEHLLNTNFTKED